MEFSPLKKHRHAFNLMPEQAPTSSSVDGLLVGISDVLTAGTVEDANLKSADAESIGGSPRRAP